MVSVVAAVAAVAAVAGVAAVTVAVDGVGDITFLANIKLKQTRLNLCKFISNNFLWKITPKYFHNN